MPPRNQPDRLTVRDTAALLGLSVTQVRSTLHGHGYHRTESPDRDEWVDKDELIAYLRAKVATPPPFTPPALPPDLEDPTDLAFARAEIRATVIRLADTIRGALSQLDAINRVLLALDKREAAERAHLPRLTPEDRITASRQTQAVEAAEAARAAAEQEALRARQQANAIKPGSGAPPHPDRYVGEGEEDEPGAYAYRVGDGRLYFLYRKDASESSQSSRQQYVFARRIATRYNLDHFTPVATIPAGYHIKEGAVGPPRLNKVREDPQVKAARKAEAEQQLINSPGYIKPGTGAPPSPDRVLRPGEYDEPGAYAYRSASGDLSFLYRNRVTTSAGAAYWRYWLQGKYGRAPHVDNEDTQVHAQIPEGYEVIEGTLGRLQLRKKPAATARKRRHGRP